MNKTVVNKLPKSKVEIKVEMPAEDFKIFSEKALEEFTRDAEIPGFRKGAAPKEVVKSKLGQAKLWDRAAMLAIEASFPAAIAENKLEPLGYPEVSILKLAEGNSFEYKAIVAVYPEIKLADYKAIAGGLKVEEVKVTDEDIKRLKMEKERHVREHMREDALAAIVAKTEVEVPEILVQRETEKMFEQLKERTPQMLHMSFDEYLKKLGKTEAELKTSMERENEQKIKNFMVLQEIGKLEKIEVSDAEAEAAMKKADEQIEEGGDMAQVKEYYRETLKSEKTFEYIDSLFKK